MLSKAPDAHCTKDLVSVDWFSLLSLRKNIGKETEWDDLVARKTTNQEWAAKDTKDCVILTKSLFFTPINWEE